MVNDVNDGRIHPMNPVPRVTRWNLNHPILAGIFYALIWMALGALTLSVILYLSPISENEMRTYTYVVHFIALFISGWTSGRISGKKGWYYGGIAGLGYALFLLLTGFLAMDAAFNLKKLVYTITAFTVGALGGIIGVNIRRTSR